VAEDGNTKKMTILMITLFSHSAILQCETTIQHLFTQNLHTYI